LSRLASKTPNVSWISDYLEEDKVYDGLATCDSIALLYSSMEVMELLLL